MATRLLYRRSRQGQGSRRAGRVDESPHFVRVFAARRRFYAARNVDGKGPHATDGFRDIVGREAAGEDEGDAEIDALEQMPRRRLPCAPERTRHMSINENGRGHRTVLAAEAQKRANASQAVFIPHGKRGHPAAEAASFAGRERVAMDLEGAQRRDTVESGKNIDPRLLNEKADGLNERRQAFQQRRNGLQRDIAWRAWIKVESQGIRPRSHRRVRIRCVRNPAYFNSGRHGRIITPGFASFRGMQMKQNLSSDPFDLQRFLQAQEGVWQHALAEVRAGRKRTHWMWFVFPQFDGLAFSSTSKLYAIKSREEAIAYLHHPVLGPRLLECCEAALDVPAKSAYEIFGSPDDMKLRSCATLFASVSPPGSVFHRMLDRFFESRPDDRTLELLGG